MYLLLLLLAGGAGQCSCDTPFVQTTPQQGTQVSFCVKNGEANVEWAVYVNGGEVARSTMFPVAAVCSELTELRAPLPSIYDFGTHAVQISGTNAGGTAWSTVVYWEIPGSPPPVDCQGFWSGWLRGSCTACVNGQQTCVESRAFTITQQPANGGVACPASPETRSVVVSCTTIISCRNLVTFVWAPQGTVYVHTFFGGTGPRNREINRWQNEGWALTEQPQHLSGNGWRLTFQCAP